MRPDDPYLSPEGYARFKAELEDLKFVQYPEMQNQVQVAAAEGDRSENAAYTFGKMRLREINRRMKELDRILQKAKIVNHVEHDGKIRFGSTVHLRHQQSQAIKTYTLVGSAEVDPVQGRISTSSPMGQVLVEKEVGQIIEVQTPRGLQIYLIEKVEFA
jgi:transcription elongation factor GreB